jgi:hypothetical protein
MKDRLEKENRKSPQRVKDRLKIVQFFAHRETPSHPTPSIGMPQKLQKTAKPLGKELGPSLAPFRSS